MNRKSVAYWTLFAVTLAVYGTMAGWTLPAIARDAGGLAALDMRPGGYSPEEARAFLVALGDRGRAIYLGPQHRLDLIYPALLALLLIGAVRALIAPLWLQICLSLLALGGMAADYLENARVAALLRRADAIPDAALVAASRATEFKAGLTALVMLAVCAGLVRAAWKAWRKT
ncbi:hypothetical protein [Pseudodonghicola flavimaris]|uniref:Uncharacterized protein n=1 Tax=Pseudodonghicola flavimaris TaxID=3050036 RepID=A0ABT7F3H9_9RHOB|nr:hypothetical protein [Pseudodonghicola flavimaris]MDK3019040.1 hypothetical protein [Pseudodonghicola flavimaris]